MADCVQADAEATEIQTVSGGSKSARRQPRRVAAANKKAARFRDELTLSQAMACNHWERWLEAMLEDLSSVSMESSSSVSCLLDMSLFRGSGFLKIKRGAQGDI